MANPICQSCKSKGKGRVEMEILIARKYLEMLKIKFKVVE